MKLVALLFLFIPAIALADCKIQPDGIKASVRKILSPLHDSFNILITENEFRLAYKKINELLGDVKACEIEFAKRASIEYKNIAIAKKMEAYRLYSSELRHIEMQLRAGYESFNLGVFRPLMFNIGMWESVANEFYKREI